MSSIIDTNVFRYVVSMVHKTFQDVEESQMRLQPLPTMNPPVWILGHIVSTLAFVPKLLGGEVTCPKEYSKWFGPGSRLEDLPAELPSKATLMMHLGAASEKILTMLPLATEADLARPNPTQFFQNELPTLRDFIENLLNGHTMLHLGQMSVWRQCRDLPRIVQVPKR